MSDVGAMVDALVEAGCAPGVAARIVAEAFTAGVASAVVRGQSVDETAEKRRERDRIRQALKRAEAKKSADNPPISADSADCPKDALTLKNINKKERARRIPCPQTWEPSESHFAKAAELNIPRSAVLEKAEDMRLWARSSGALKMDWDATFHGFIRRDIDKLRAKPGLIETSKPVEPDAKAVEFYSKFKRWHRDYGPEPGTPGCRAAPEILAKYGFGEAA